MWKYSELMPVTICDETIRSGRTRYFSRIVYLVIVSIATFVIFICNFCYSGRAIILLIYSIMVTSEVLMPLFKIPLFTVSHYVEFKSSSPHILKDWKFDISLQIFSVLSLFRVLMNEAVIWSYTKNLSVSYIRSMRSKSISSIVCPL